MDLFSRLVECLDESESALQGRMKDTWCSRAGENQRSLVLFGAGALGRKIHAALAGSELSVLAFSDNDPRKWGTHLDGLPVLSPAQAVERYGGVACFVVSIWRAEGEPHRFPETEARLNALGVLHVAHFTHLAWRHPQKLAPHYSLDLPQCVREARKEVLAALALFHDEHSRDLFLRHALWRLTLDFDLLPPTDPDEIYFPEGLFPRGKEDVLADAGAFDGDTCRRMLELWGGRAKRIHAFEPDPASALKFQGWVKEAPDRDRIHFHPMALGSQSGTLRFQGSGALNATSSSHGGTEVPCRTLDEVLGEDPPDFIKMDIEGAELDALKGATALLRRGPGLAICLYHVQDHLWSIPLFVHAHMPNHQLHLRYHGTDAWELVLYAVPGPEPVPEKNPMALPLPVPRSCPVCDSSAQELIHDHRLAPIEGVSVHAGYRVVACQDCQMVYADGLPAQEAFDHYYQACSKFEDATRSGLPSPVDQRRFRAIADELAATLPSKEDSIGEIGSSTGGLLAELKHRGFQRLLGVDPSPLCGRRARELHGLEVAQGTIFAPLPDGPHDVLIAVGVIEHIRDLDRALVNLSGALKPDGLLYVEVPDLEGFHLTNEAPFQEFSTDHINFFTQRSLENLMHRHGFHPAFGHIVQRVHSGGSTMQVVAWVFRKGVRPTAHSPQPDPAGPAAARHYKTLCEAQSTPEHDLMNRLAHEGTPIAVWGAGTVACRLMATTALRDVPIEGFVDSNPHVQGYRLGGAIIHPPEWLKTFSGPILIASRGYGLEIERTLREDLKLTNPMLTL